MGETLRIAAGVCYATTGDGHASLESLAHEAMYAAQRSRSRRDAGAGAAPDADVARL
jgi:hypothetical protein